MLELVQKAGWVALPLGIFSVIALGIVLERLYSLAKVQRIEAEAFAAMKKALMSGGTVPELPSELADAPVSMVISSVAEIGPASDESRHTTAEIAVSLQRLRLRKYLALLATIGSVSPFVGLFGTVLGVLYSFQSMQTKGLGGSEMAAGIGEALSATAVGLAVAIPSVMAYNYFTNRVQRMVLEVHSHAAALIPHLGSRTGASGKQEA